ncbi:polypeptide deformylase [Candidatus Blochmanniella floridana]|uniref:Peptide deformylase n=1 Tax=Blochmanniella floridana TaxID=203907 RepID=DEF_BLOFL|nr:RecName: Full=Peptide deformylase; Short=PDF; AltName: Full=Polypeptide deformylase [Candidatus Blochmannia floridanus]CAD83734.1 polypeptide deformylase [Candidatus Blochmannia floridanus]
MSILQMLYYPDQRLRKIARSVSIISHDTKKIISDMFETMYFQQGIGLAATQVDIHQKIIVIDLNNNIQKRLVFINPCIIKKIGTITHIIEGCLSIPKIRASVPRSQNIIVQSLDENGNNFEMEATDLLSVCIQHEIDHLLGKLFIDYLSPFKIQRIHKKINKWSTVYKNHIKLSH